MIYGTPTEEDPTNVVGRRVVAYLIDSALLFGLAILVWATKVKHLEGAPVDVCELLRNQESTSACFQSGSDLYYVKGSDAAILYLVLGGAGFLMHVVMQGLTGASLGKFLTGLRVVDGQGRICGIPRALLRWVLLVVDGFCFIVGLVVVLATHPHRRVGDFAAGTYVVSSRNVGRPPFRGAAPPPDYAAGTGGWGAGGTGPPGWAPPGAYPPPAAPPGPAPWDAPPPPTPGWGAPR